MKYFYRLQNISSRIHTQNLLYLFPFRYSRQKYNGNMTEFLFYSVDGLEQMLGEQIQAYNQTAGTDTVKLDSVEEKEGENRVRASAKQ